MNRIARLTAALIVSATAATAAFAAPETYAIDGTHTFPNFSYNHFGLTTHHYISDADVIEHSIDRLIAMWEGDEAPEGIAAFFEKRKPRWQS